MRARARVCARTLVTPAQTRAARALAQGRPSVTPTFFFLERGIALLSFLLFVTATHPGSGEGEVFEIAVEVDTDVFQI